jgi:hypothetical protein
MLSDALTLADQSSLPPEIGARLQEVLTLLENHREGRGDSA